MAFTAECVNIGHIWKEVENTGYICSHIHAFAYEEAFRLAILITQEKLVAESSRTLAIISIALIAVLTFAVVAAECVDTICMLMASMFSSTTFIHFHTVELIKPAVTREALTYVGAIGINTTCVAVAVMTL